ncbi:MAG TPA: hypothetical protein VGT24_09415 [Candidatus Acidoferrales bacterium]|nr:hypothetical protein [Candidatus Acidoferrales bacterium]
METGSAFYGDAIPSGICPVVSALFGALAGFDVTASYKIRALRSAIDFLASAERLQRKLPSDMLCIPLCGDKN